MKETRNKIVRGVQEDTFSLWESVLVNLFTDELFNITKRK